MDTYVSYMAPDISKLNHEQLLMHIEEDGFYAIALMDPAKAIVGKIFPRGKFAFPWRVRQIHLWRLPHLKQPLWLGSDGEIYRAYDIHGESNPQIMREPHHWKRAEIERRHERGLRRIVRALTDHLNCSCNYNATHDYE